MKKALILAIVFMALCFSCSEEDAVPVFIARKIVITSVEVTEWPKLSPDGSGWDFTSAPDIVFSIDDGVTVLYQSPVQDNSALSTYNFSVGKTISDFSKQHAVVLWDIDSPDDDDQIGAYFLKFSDYLPASSTPKFSDYPTSINLTSQSGFKVKLSVTWEE